MQMYLYIHIPSLQLKIPLLCPSKIHHVCFIKSLVSGGKHNQVVVGGLKVKTLFALCGLLLPTPTYFFSFLVK